MQDAALLRCASSEKAVSCTLSVMPKAAKVDKENSVWPHGHSLQIQPSRELIKLTTAAQLFSTSPAFPHRLCVNLLLCAAGDAMLNCDHATYAFLGDYASRNNYFA